ncbi:MFS transporter [Helicobacter sp. MIT 14-3879]|nr:MFS transporter [Helicobacter sp. MIT 14-3879]
MEQKVKKQYDIYSKIFYFSLFSVSAMTVLGSTTIAPSLPNLEKHFNNIKNIEMLSKLVLTLPAIFVVIFSPISGYLFDKFERLKIIYIAMITWSISGFIGFFLDDIYYILTSRAIFGIATAFVMTGASALIADYYIGAKREKALSIQGFFTAFGGALFLIMGGFLSNIDWRYPFLVYLLGFIIFAFAFKVLFEPQRLHKQISQSNEKFNFIKFLPIYIISFFAMSMFYIIPTQAPFFITHILNKGGELIGISLAISSVITAFSSLFYTRLRIYFKLNEMYCIGFCAMGVGYCLIYIFHNYLILLTSFIFIGFSLGILLITNSSWLFSLTNDSIRAKAYGFLASSVFMGQFLSPFITQPIAYRFGIINMFLIFGILLLAIGVIFLKIFKNI